MPDHRNPGVTAGWDAEGARARSVALLGEHGLRVPERVPPTALRDPRPTDEVVRRAQALFALLAVVDGDPVVAVLDVLAERALMPALTDRERAHLEAVRRGDEDEDEHVQLSWRIEGLMALGWALGLLPALPATGEADGIADALEPIDLYGLAGGVDARVALRPAEELAEAADLLRCAHDALLEQPEPESVVQGVVWERRLGLEWVLTPGAAWEDLLPDA